MVVSGRRLASALTLFASVLWLVLVSVAHAAPGDLDTTFGSGGIVSSSTGTTESFGWAADVAVQSDGKIIVVSTYVSNSDSQKEFLVERYNSNGTLDSSFGSGGIVKTSFGGTEAQASSVIIEPGGTILVDGAADGEFALARYNSNGTLDTSFGGGDGMSTSAVSVPEASGFWSESGSMAVLPSGKIVLGGSTDIRAIGEDGEPYIAPHMVLARFNEDGTLDTSYGTNGIAAGPAGNLYGLTADSSDRILVAGWSNYEFAVARFTSSGSLDTSFAGTGLVQMDLSETGSKAAEVLVLPSGKILASGYGNGMTIFRFNEDGSLDSSFGGGDGTVTPSFSYPCCISSSAVALALDEDGRIVIVGAASAASAGLKPSEAPLIAVGQHYFGNAGHASNAWRPVDVWRLPPLLTGDAITIAWHGGQGPALCLAQNIDDYNWAEVDNQCNGSGEYFVASNGSARTVIEAKSATSNAFLEFSSYCACERSEPYDFTIESIQHAIGVGLTPVTEITPTSTLIGSANLSNGSPVPDGMAFTVSASWVTPVNKASHSRSYTVASSGGALAFLLSLPSSAEGKHVSLTVTRSADPQYLAASSPAIEATVAKLTPPRHKHHRRRHHHHRHRHHHHRR